MGQDYKNVLKIFKDMLKGEQVCIELFQCVFF